MGNAEDARKVIQDFVVADMKAIQVRIESLEKEMNLRFSASEKQGNAQFTSRRTAMDLRFSTSEQLAAQRQETALNARGAYHTTVMDALEMERRLGRLESERKLDARPHEQ